MPRMANAPRSVHRVLALSLLLLPCAAGRGRAAPGGAAPPTITLTAESVAVGSDVVMPASDATEAEYPDWKLAPLWSRLTGESTDTATLVAPADAPFGTLKLLLHTGALADLRVFRLQPDGTPPAVVSVSTAGVEPAAAEAMRVTLAPGSIEATFGPTGRIVVASDDAVARWDAALARLASERPDVPRRGVVLAVDDAVDQRTLVAVVRSLHARGLGRPTLRLSPDAVFFRGPRAPGTHAVDVPGALDREIIRRVIRRHGREHAGCYEAALVRRQEAAGKVVARFVVASDGRVIATDVLSSEIRDVELARCMTDAIAKWRFPAPRGGGMVAVTYPFVFRAAPDATPAK